MKFGTNTAAEFDFLQPITKMTPIPFEVVQEIFPTDVKEDTEKEVEEHTVSRETARNVAMLAEWEDDFDSIIDEDDDYDDDDDEMKMGSSTGRRMPKPGGRTMKRGRKRTPHKRPRKQRRESSSSNSRRRESSIFSRERKSLIDPDDSMEVEDGEDCRGGSNDNSNGGGGRGANGRDGGLPFSVTIDPEEYTSPSSTSVSADSVSTLGTPAALRAKNKESSSANNAAGTSKMVPTKQCSNGGKDRDSLDSACISPSSLKSSLAVVVDGNNNNDSTTTMVDTSFELKSSLAVDCCNDSSSSLDVSFESIVGRDSNDSNTTGKATPNSARTSSSTILRAVHASGALLPGNHHSPSQGGRRGVVPSSGTGNNVGRDGGNGRLRPNQLRYSPSSSSGSSTCPLKMVSLTKQCLQELRCVMQHFLSTFDDIIIYYFPYHLS